MKLLLDTHAFIWWDTAPSKLSPAAIAAIRDANNTVLLSVACIWEMQIKHQIGKLPLRLPLSQIISQQLTNGLQLLSLEVEHIIALEKLPPVHKDPFDRLLVAQSITEGASLLSADAAYAGYPVQIIW